MKVLNNLFLKTNFKQSLTRGFINDSNFINIQRKFAMVKMQTAQKKHVIPIPPANLEIIRSETPIDSHSLVVSPPEGINEWAHRYFPLDKKITLPIFDFNTSSYTGENVVLDQDIFNQIVRRDLIHRVLLFNQAYNRRTYKWVMSKGDVSGSNRKPFRQKKTGRAPQGDIRAPHLYHGGRAHGARPKNYYFPLNKKIRLFGLKSLLTSKFLENKIIIVNSEKSENPNEYFVERRIKFLKENRSVFITSSDPCVNFRKAVKKFKHVEHLSPDKLNVEKALKAKYIVLTLDGLKELVQTLQERHFNYFRNKKIVPDPHTARLALPTDKYNFDFDPNKELIIHTPALQGSLQEIEDHYRNPQKKVQEILDRREKVKQDEERAKEERRQREAENLYADNSAVERRRAQLKRERKMKLMKEMRRQTLKKKKQQDAAIKKQQEQSTTKKK